MGMVVELPTMGPTVGSAGLPKVVAILHKEQQTWDLKVVSQIGLMVADCGGRRGGADCCEELSHDEQGQEQVSVDPARRLR